MTVYGYARVSSKDQNLARQLQALKEAGCEKIFQEKISGATTEREQLKELLATIKEGDTIIISDTTRISRSLKDLLDLVEQFKEKKVALKSIKEPWLDTTTNNPMSDLLLTIMGGLSEFERANIKERQAEGIAIAKKKGKYEGRPKKYTERHAGMQHAIDLYKSGEHTVKEICEITKIGRSSLYRALDERGITR